MQARKEAYRFLGCIGTGAYSDVWKALDTLSGRLVAIKVLQEAHTCTQIMRLTVREVRILQSVCHPNLVRLLMAFQSRSGRVHLVFEHMETSLQAELESNPRGLPPAILKAAAWQVLRAAAHLHENDIMHRDIKPANILMDNNGVVKLCDFGLARRTGRGARGDHTPYVVTRWYRAPEILVGGDYGPNSDVWSIGCTIAELATGKPLFAGKSGADQVWQIALCLGPLPQPQPARARHTAHAAACKPPSPDGVVSSIGDMESLPPEPQWRLRARLSSLDPLLLDLLEACLQPDLRRRPSCEQVLQMPYFWDVPRLVRGTELEAFLPSRKAACDDDIGAGTAAVAPRGSALAEDGIAAPSAAANLATPINTVTAIVDATNATSTGGISTTAPSAAANATSFVEAHLVTPETTVSIPVSAQAAAIGSSFPLLATSAPKGYSAHCSREEHGKVPAAPSSSQFAWKQLDAPAATAVATAATTATATAVKNNCCSCNNRNVVSSSSSSSALGNNACGSINSSGKLTCSTGHLLQFTSDALSSSVVSTTSFPSFTPALPARPVVSVLSVQSIALTLASAAAAKASAANGGRGYQGGQATCANAGLVAAPVRLGNARRTVVINTLVQARGNGCSPSSLCSYEGRAMEVLQRPREPVLAGPQAAAADVAATAAPTPSTRSQQQMQTVQPTRITETEKPSMGPAKVTAVNISGIERHCDGSAASVPVIMAMLTSGSAQPQAMAPRVSELAASAMCDDAVQAPQQPPPAESVKRQDRRASKVTRALITKLFKGIAFAQRRAQQTA